MSAYGFSNFISNKYFIGIFNALYIEKALTSFIYVLKEYGNIWDSFYKIFNLESL